MIYTPEGKNSLRRGVDGNAAHEIITIIRVLIHGLDPSKVSLVFLD